MSSHRLSADQNPEPERKLAAPSYRRDAPPVPLSAMHVVDIRNIVHRHTTTTPALKRLHSHARPFQRPCHILPQISISMLQPIRGGSMDIHTHPTSTSILHNQ